MKHATPESLDRLEELLLCIRGLQALKEKSRGVFYARSRAALHFHEDPSGLFVDVRTAEEWERLPVRTRAEQAALMQRLAATFGGD